MTQVLALPGRIAPGTGAPPFRLPVLRSPGASDGIPPEGARGLTLLAFYKNSCPTCRLAFPLLQRIHERVAPAGGRVVGISQDGETGAAAFAAEMGLTFPILIDGPGWPVSRLYGLESVPSIYVVDPGGAIRMSGAGFAREELQEMARALGESVGVDFGSLYEPGERFPEFKPG